MASIGERLRELRARRRMTQAMLAEKSGVAQSLISQYEKNITAIGIKNIVKLAKTLRCKIADIDDRIDGRETSEKTNAPRAATNKKSENRFRYIADDILLAIVDRWKKVSPDTKIDIATMVRNGARGKKK